MNINYVSFSIVLSLILEFFPARLAMIPYGLHSNVTKLLANLLTKPSVYILLFCQLRFEILFQ